MKRPAVGSLGIKQILPLPPPGGLPSPALAWRIKNKGAGVHTPGPLVFDGQSSDSSPSIEPESLVPAKTPSKSPAKTALSHLPTTKLAKAPLAKLATPHLAESTLAKLATTKSILAKLSAPEATLSKLATANLSQAALAKLAELTAGSTQHVSRLDRYHRIGTTGAGGPHDGAGGVGAIRIVVTRSVDSAIANRSTNSTAKSALAKLPCPHLAESALAKLTTKPGLARLPTAQLPTTHLGVTTQLPTARLATTTLLPTIHRNHRAHGWRHRWPRGKRGPVLGHQASSEQSKRQKPD